MKKFIQLSAALLTGFILMNVVLSFRTKQIENGLLQNASFLLQHITNSNTAYKHKTDDVAWGESNFHCYTDCSGFIKSLFVKTYRWTDEDFKNKFGHKRPYAYHYYEAINAQKEFKKIDNINDVEPGDIVSLQYADRSEHEDNTGHCMVVAGKPFLKTAPKKNCPAQNSMVLQ